MHQTALLAGGVSVAALLATGCGAASESGPPASEPDVAITGDVPDDPYASVGGFDAPNRAIEEVNYGGGVLEGVAAQKWCWKEALAKSTGRGSRESGLTGYARDFYFDCRQAFADWVDAAR